MLRRSEPRGPLLLAGILLDNRFFARSGGSTDGLDLTKGKVALAPLTAVEASTAEEAAEIASVDAAETWNGPNSPGPVQRGAKR